MVRMLVIADGPASAFASASSIYVRTCASLQHGIDMSTFSFTRNTQWEGDWLSPGFMRGEKRKPWGPMQGKGGFQTYCKQQK